MDQIRSLNFVIRAATTNDIAALTELHCASFRPEEHVPVMLGRDYVRAAYRWLITSNRAYCIVADSAGKVIGLVGVCDGPFTLPMFIACLPEFMKSVLRSPGLLLRKALWSRLFRRPDVSKTSRKLADQPGFAQMTIGAVDPEYRGAGVFPALVEATITQSKNRGSRAIRSGIYKSNQPSRRVFDKGGWIELPSWKHVIRFSMFTILTRIFRGNPVYLYMRVSDGSGTSAGGHGQQPKSLRIPRGLH